MTFYEFEKIFEGDSADKFASKVPPMSMVAEGRVLRVQTQKRPPAALAEILYIVSLTIQCDGPYIKCDNVTLKITQSQR